MSEPQESMTTDLGEYSVDDEDQPQSGGDSLVDDRGLAALLRTRAPAGQGALR